MAQKLTLLLILWIFLFSFSSISFAYSTISTQNFTVYFLPAYEELAYYTAAMAEEIRPVIIQRLNAEFDEHTYIILFDHTDSANGFARVISGHNVIGLFTVPPLTWGPNLPGAMVSYWEYLFAHEFAHIVHLNKRKGIFSFFHQVFGRLPFISTPNQLISTALIEAVATYEETALTNGRGHHYYWEMLLRTKALEKQFLTFDQALGLYDLDRWNPGPAPYLYGYSWRNYMAYQYGEESFIKFDKTTATWGPLGINSAFKQATGLSPKAFHHEWQEWMEERGAAQLADIKRESLTDYQLLPSLGNQVNYPSYSPDGRFLTYVTRGGGIVAGIRTIDLKTMEEKGLVEYAYGPFTYTMEQQIIYGFFGLLPNGREEFSLVLLDPSTGEKEELANTQRSMAPSAARNAKRLAWLTFDGASITTKIKVADYLHDEGNLTLQHPVTWWQGDRQHFATSVNLSADGHQLIATIQGQGVTRLVLFSEPFIGEEILSASMVANPVFSNDGGYLLFSADLNGVANIYAYDLYGKELYQVTHLTTGALSPAIAPNRDAIAFSLYAADGFVLATMPLDPLEWRSPIPPYTGEHWQSPPWHKELQNDWWVPGKSLEVSNEAIQPYQPLRGIAPNYWFPLILASQGEPVVGIMTGGEDILGHYNYFFQVGYGLESSLPILSFDLYWQEQLIPYRGFGLDLNIWTRPNIDENSLVPMANLFLHHTRPAIQLEEGATNRTIQGGFTGIDLLDPILDDIRGYGGMNLQRFSYRDFVVVESHYGFKSSILLDATSPSITIHHSSHHLFRDSNYKIGYQLALGYAGAGTGPLLGGVYNDFAIPGLKVGELGTIDTGDLLLKMGIDATIPLLAIHRGSIILPLFLNRINMRPFVEAGFTTTLKGEEPVDRFIASVGVDLSTDFTILYGPLIISPFIGVSKVLGGDLKEPDLRLFVGLRF